MKHISLIKIFILFVLIDKSYSQNLIKSNQLKKVLPSNDKVMTTEIKSIPGTNYFFTTGDSKSKLWDLGSKKMLAEINNIEEKRSSIAHTTFLHIKQKLVVQLSFTNLNIYSFPDLNLVHNTPFRSNGSDILFNQQWDYFFYVVDDSIHKISLHNFNIIESHKLKYSIEELGYFSDSTALFYKLKDKNKQFGIASVNNPHKITWSEIDYDVEEFINESIFLVKDKKNKKISDYNKEYFFYDKLKNKIYKLDSIKTAPKNGVYSKLTGTYFYNDSYYKSKSCVNAFSINKGLTEKYICPNSDSVKNKINKIVVDEELKLVWILDEYQLNGYDIYTYEKKYEINIKGSDFYRIGNGLICINDNETISFVRNLKENNFALEDFKSNFMAKIYGVNHIGKDKLLAITENGVTMIDLKTLNVNTLHQKQKSELKFSNKIDFQFWESRYASRENELLYFSDNTIYNFKFKSLYYDKQKEELYYLDNKLIKKVNVNYNPDSAVIFNKIELADSDLKNIEFIQFHPDSEFIYYAVWINKFDELNSKKSRRYSDNFSNQYKLYKKSLISKEEKNIPLLENIQFFEPLKFGYLSIRLFKEQVKDEVDFNNLKSESTFYEPNYKQFIYKIENEKLIIDDSIIELSRYSTFKSEKLLHPEFTLFQNDSGIFIYHVSTKKLEQIIRLTTGKKKSNINYDKFYFDYKNNLFVIYGFTANNIVYDLKSKKIISEFKAHQWQQNSVGSIGVNSFYTANDQEINFWDENFKNVFKLFLHKNGGIYIHDTSEYYYALKGVVKDLHFIDKKLNIVDFNQIDPFCNRPDIILSGLTNFFHTEKSELIDIMASACKKRLHKLGLENIISKNLVFSFPEVNINNKNQIKYENSENNLKLEISAKDTLYKLKSFNVIINEVPIYGSNGISLFRFNKHNFDTTLYVPLSNGKNKIQVSVMNELGLENFKYSTYVNYIPEKNDIVAKTYYFGIGVDTFKQEIIYNKNPKFNKETKLNFCVKDVNDLGNVFSEDPNTIVKLYTNKQVNKENILSIKKFLLENTTVNDRVIISCSSHGLLDNKKNFYLAMHDIDFDNPSVRGLAYEELENLLDGIPARKKLLLLDACNSGENELLDNNNKPTINSDKNNVASSVTARGGVKVEHNSFHKMNELFINTRNNTGSVIISAAGGQQNALEGNAVRINNKAIENGAFTFSVLEYLNNHNNKEELTVNKLKQYVEGRVEEITKGKQEPTSRQETMEVDWQLK